MKAHMIRIAHIINTVTKEENPELYKVGQITIRSILHAKAVCRRKESVILMGIGFSQHDQDLSTEFKQLPPLTSDTTHAPLNDKRRLPFIKDILEAALKYSDAEYVVYSNLDIGLMPFFYDTVFDYIEKGYDAMVINRRRIRDVFTGTDNLEMIYAEAGEKHPGYDCFVFKRETLQRFKLKQISLGVPPIGNDLFHNVFTYADKPVLFSDKHLTFHLGMTVIKDWGAKAIEKYNYKEYRELLLELYPFMSADKFPGGDLGFFTRHFKWLFNFTFSYPLMFKLDMKRGFKRKKRVMPDEKKQRYIEWIIRKATFRDP